MDPGLAILTVVTHACQSTSITTNASDGEVRHRARRLALEAQQSQDRRDQQWSEM